MPPQVLAGRFECVNGVGCVTKTDVHADTDVVGLVVDALLAMPAPFEAEAST
jgi:hypothetical protein